MFTFVERSPYINLCLETGFNLAVKVYLHNRQKVSQYYWPGLLKINKIKQNPFFSAKGFNLWTSEWVTFLWLARRYNCAFNLASRASKTFQPNFLAQLLKKSTIRCLHSNYEGNFTGGQTPFLLFHSTIEVVDIHSKQKIKKRTKACVLVNLYSFCQKFILRLSSSRGKLTVGESEIFNFV